MIILRSISIFILTIINLKVLDTIASKEKLLYAVYVHLVFRPTWDQLRIDPSVYMDIIGSTKHLRRPSLDPPLMWFADRFQL